MEKDSRRNRERMVGVEMNAERRLFGDTAWREIERTKEK